MAEVQTPFHDAHCAAYNLMSALYNLRYHYPPDKYPEIWALIPEAQTLLVRIQKNLIEANKYAHDGDKEKVDG